MAGDSDHLGAGWWALTPDRGVEAAWGIPLPANHGVATLFCASLKEVGNDTQPALSPILNLNCVILAASCQSNEGKWVLF